jgi:hypothetical protein
LKPGLSPAFVTATALACAALLGACGSPDRPASWQYISPVIFQPNCATGSCHSPGVAAAGLDFSTPDKGYTSLTKLWVWIVDRTKEGEPGCGPAAGTIVCEKPFRPLITPYSPSESRLINMLRGRNAPRMPPDRPLDEADIRLVENWILNGAKRWETDVVDAGVDAVRPKDAASPDLVSDAHADALGDGGDALTDGGVQ